MDCLSRRHSPQLPCAYCHFYRSTAPGERLCGLPHGCVPPWRSKHPCSMRAYHVLPEQVPSHPARGTACLTGTRLASSQTCTRQWRIWMIPTASMCVGTQSSDWMLIQNGNAVWNAPPCPSASLLWLWHQTKGEFNCRSRIDPAPTSAAFHPPCVLAYSHILRETATGILHLLNILMAHHPSLQ